MSDIWLFDAMDTLVRDPFYVEMPRFHGVSHADLMVAADPQAWFDFESGKISESDYAGRAFYDGRRFDVAGLRACLRDSYEWLPGMEEMIASLASSGVTMCVLSNYPVWFDLIEEKLNLSRYFSRLFVSYRMGVRKPDAAAFQTVLDAMGARAAECVFVDDRLANCDAAARLGMAVHHFSSAHALRTFADATLASRRAGGPSSGARIAAARVREDLS